MEMMRCIRSENYMVGSNKDGVGYSKPLILRFDKQYGKKEKQQIKYSCHKLMLAYKCWNIQYVK
jgi:hypothetical protein